ncbi:unnamed protein product, partial [marine sediment metagenome]
RFNDVVSGCSAARSQEFNHTFGSYFGGVV